MKKLTGTRKRTRATTNEVQDEPNCSNETLAHKLKRRMRSCRQKKDPEIVEKNNNILKDDSSDTLSENQTTKRTISAIRSDKKYSVQEEILNSNMRSDDFLSDLYRNGFQGKPYHSVSKTFHPLSESSSTRNILHFFQNTSVGLKSRLQLRKSLCSPVVNLVSNLQLNRVASPFDRRVTALEWHPINQNILAVGSKGGDIIMLDVEKINTEKFVTGAGAGGSCQALKFWPWDHSRVLTASIDGTVTLHDFSGVQKLTLADTTDPYDHWYCSIDVQPARYLVAAGRNHGILHLMSTEGRKVFEGRLHKNKITHVEFSPREDWLLCTASSDQTVQLWDVRMLKDRSSTLCVLPHNRVINSAYFSSTDGCRLLTTDQADEIRVYRAPHWALETTIKHPHRFFQHITPFKATWHPHQDLIVVGRYPVESTDSRSIDLYDADTGGLLAQITDPGAKGLSSLNKFNKQGDILASSMGFHILIWNRREVLAQIQESLMKDLKSAGLPSASSRSTGSRSAGSRTGRRHDNQTDDIDKQKKKAKKKCETQTSDQKVKLKTKTKPAKR